jgi:hypothetical protein
MAHATDYPSRNTYWRRREEGRRKDTTIDTLVLGFLKRCFYDNQRAWPTIVWTEASMKKAAMSQYIDFGLKSDQYDAIKAAYEIFHQCGLEQPQKHGVKP